MRVSRRIEAYDIVVHVVLLGFALLCLYPPLHVAAVSLSGVGPIMRGEVGVIPLEFNLEAYRRIIAAGDVPRGFRNSVWYTLLGTSINLGCTAPMAFALSRRRLALRGFYTTLVIISMFFSGGLIPLFLVVLSLGLYNTVWAVTLPVAVSAFNLIIMRTFYAAVPVEMDESAHMDGANDITIFIRIILPLSTAAIATIGLFYAVTHWNDWFRPMIFFRDRRRFPLPMILREVVIRGTIAEEALDMEAEEHGWRLDVSVEAIKYATLFASMAPMLVVYPFVQKYFVKGVMIGSLKG